MTHNHPNPNVVVIGGGPAGSTAATLLSRQGFHVFLLEREQFPRPHVGESLLPASMPVLEDLGVLPSVEAAGFPRKWGATMVWGKDPDPWSWRFRETNREYPHAYQVWRPEFDRLLLDNSRDCGVAVREGCRVDRVVFDGGRAVGVGFHDDNGRAGLVEAGFVVDASGQGGLLARQLGLRRWDSFFQNLAVYGYFTGGKGLPAPDENNIFIEAYHHGWLWNIPLRDGWASVGAVVDSLAGQEEIRVKGPAEFLKNQVSQAPRMADLLAHAELQQAPTVVKDWSYVCRPMVGNGYILAGDAACFVDPLFSSGVHLALMSGALAAAYITAAARDSELAQAAREVYEKLYLKEYSHFRELAKLFYSSNRTPDSYFWEARRLAAGDPSLSPRNAFIQTVAGQAPRGYERAVLGRGELPQDFHASIEQVEGERKLRRARWASGREKLHQSIPRLTPRARLERKPMLSGGEFQWGYVLTTPDRPEGIECSELVAVALSRMDGAATVGQIITRMQESSNPAQQAQIEESVVAALEILYVDGVIEELTGI